MSDVSVLFFKLQTSTHIEHLTECIRESRRPIGLFLGAGCSKSLPGDEEEQGDLIPATQGMTIMIRDRVLDAGYEEAWRLVVDRVKEPEEQLKEVNIEDILSQLRGLIQYGGEDGFGGIRLETLEDLETEITEGIVDLVAVELPEGDSGYLDLAKWLGSIERHEPVEIFTTNYDLLIEEALERRRISYFDGFVGGHRPFFDRYSVTNDDIPPSWIRLWKLHGSMNWVSIREDDSTRIWRTDDIEGERAVIHPSHLKYNQSRKMPYLTLIDRLKTFLKRDESVLFIVGYSFGDEHINDVISQALREAPSSSVFAFMYGDISDYSDAIGLAKKRGNFSLFGRYEGIIGTKSQQWESYEEEPSIDSDIIGMEIEEFGPDEWRETFTLGNFAKFGQFLQSVTGTGRE